MSQHALLSPSSAERWMTCPGSTLMEKGLPDQSSVYSDEGTAAHLLGAACLEGQRNPNEYKGQKIAVGSRFDFDGAVWDEEEHLNSIGFAVRGTYTVDDDMIEHVGRYVDDVRRYAEGAQSLMVEQRVPIFAFTREPDAAGTSDAVIVRPGELQVHDLKYGMGVKVDAEENKQLMLYALGVREVLDLVEGPFDVIRLVIHQPRLQHLSEWSCTGDELDIFADTVRLSATNALATYDGEIPPLLVPSDDGCRWCKAKATCPELAKFVRDTSAGDFEELKTFPIAQGRLRQEDPGVLAQKMRAVGLVEDWCKAVRAEVERQLFAGVVIPGFKIVQGKRGNRQWSQADVVEAELKRMRLKMGQMYSFKLLGPPAIEKVLKDHPIQWGKLQKMVEQREGQPSVAPESDPRPVWIPPDSSADFTEVK